MRIKLQSGSKKGTLAHWTMPITLPKGLDTEQHDDKPTTENP